MKDVIIDVYRRGGGYGTEPYSRARLKALRDEDVPLRISNKYVRNSYPADRIAPLEKFLERNAGRPWNDVYSEIREHCDTRNIRGQHLWEHVISEVHEKYPWRRYRFGAFVDDDGLLQYARRPKYHRPEPPITRIPIDENSWFELITSEDYPKHKKGWVPVTTWYQMTQTTETYNIWEYEWKGKDKIPVRLRPYTREIIIKRTVGKNTLKKIRKYLIDKALEKIQAP